jgi:uncharacterized protein (DUF111 family)
MQGWTWKLLKKGLAGLDFYGYKLTAEKVVRSGITATKFDVVMDEEEHEHHHETSHHHHRGLS